jgi:hypothetical protein
MSKMNPQISATPNQTNKNEIAATMYSNFPSPSRAGATAGGSAASARPLQPRFQARRWVAT